MARPQSGSKLLRDYTSVRKKKERDHDNLLLIVRKHTVFSRQ